MGNLLNVTCDESKVSSSQIKIPYWVLEILWFLPVAEAIKAIIYVKPWSKKLLDDRDQSLWAWCCAKYANDYLLYSPSMTHRYSDQSKLLWENYFWQLQMQKDLWNPDRENVAVERHNIRVACRFRPARVGNRAYYERCLESHSDDDEEDVSNRPRTVVLPLHQRIQLIKATNKTSSSKEAFQVMKEEGSLFRELIAKEAGESKSEAKLAEEDRRLPHQGEFVAKVQAVLPAERKVVVMTPTAGLREFEFEDTFSAEATQQEVFEQLSNNGCLVADFVNGTNVTVLVFGQTGSGKTHTMYGPDGWAAAGHGASHGLIPRMCQDVVAALEYRREQSRMDTRLLLSYVEVYGDQVCDLLGGGGEVGTRTAAARLVLEGAAEEAVGSWAQVQDCLERGEEQKRFAATRMNERSSRAHTLLTLKLVQHCRTTDLRVTSHLVLADLGGSEQVKKSGVDSGDGERMKEAVQINLGLLALKQVIQALKAGRQHVPYNDSRLTMLLARSLGGNSKTSVVLCGSPEPEHVNETLNTLRFGEQCREVTQERRDGVATIAGVLDGIEAEMARLEGEIRRKERWVTKKTVRRDVNAEEGTLEAQQGEGEQVTTTVLEGAEEERAKLEELVVRRAELRGDDIERALLTAGFAGFGEYSSSAIGTKQPKTVQRAADSRFEGGVEFDNGLMNGEKEDVL